MPRKAQITFRDDKVDRDYTLTYLDDSPERQEAVQFFRSLRQPSCLIPSLSIPEVIRSMSTNAAQEYLDAHPMQEQWSLLSFSERDPVSDDDLVRLQYLPELEVLKVFSNRITDLGVRHFCSLSRLNQLVLYSNNVTDACFDHITRIRTLVLLDMQMSRRVSRSAYLAATKRLPSIQDSYPPSV
jgi:hypothetical protein